MITAAEVLGYDENSWNNCLQVPLVEECWYELTPEQQDAAIVLGRNEEVWTRLLYY